MPTFICQKTSQSQLHEYSKNYQRWLESLSTCLEINKIFSSIPIYSALLIYTCMFQTKTQLLQTRSNKENKLKYANRRKSTRIPRLRSNHAEKEEAGRPNNSIQNAINDSIFPSHFLRIALEVTHRRKPTNQSKKEKKDRILLLSSANLPLNPQTLQQPSLLS